MKLKIRKRLSAILSIIMFVSLFANSGMVVFAAGTNINELDYVEDENGVFEYRAVDDTVYGTITVPEGYVFLVDNEVNVTADEIYLASGAQLAIFGTGTLTCSTITASDGATMCLESNANIPSGVTAVYDGENDITGDTAWEWFTFIYDNGTWYANIEPPFETHYEFCINGLEAGDAYTVEYSYDNVTYIANGVSIENGNCVVDIEGVPEDWDNKLYFRVVLNLGDGDTKELLEYGFGWNGESYTIGMDNLEAGEEGLNVVKDTYQLTFCYPNVSDGLYPHDIHLQVGVPGAEEEPEEPEEPPFETHYDFCINGLEAGDTYTVEYSYDGTNYSAEGVGIDENENRNCWVDIQGIPGAEGWNGPLYFKVELNLGEDDSKELLEYGFGWSDENQSYTINEGDNRTGEDYLNVAKDTYQLTFCYPDVSDTSYPHDIHLQVGVPGAEEDPEEPEETETTVTFRVENYGNADGSHNATGTVYYKFNTEENFTSVTATDMIDGTLVLEIPDGATTVTVKAEADPGSEVNKYNIDFPVANSGNFINEGNVDEIHTALTGDGYVFDLSAGSPEFCIRFTQANAKHYILWNTLSWGGGNVTLENGTVECKKIIFDGVTYTTDSSEVGGNIHSISEITNNWNTAISYKTLDGDTIGYDIFVLPYSPEVVVEFELMPAKGYQIASIPSGAMDDQIGEGNDIITAFVPQEASATYRYTFDGSRNIHYVPTFSEGTNTAEVTGSSVTSADVATGNNNIAGNLGLSVAEMTESNASSTIKEAVAGADAVYLDIDLNQIISKGAGRGEWETSLTELENEVTISLDVAGYDSNKSYYIVREHDGTCDRLEATYNTTTGKLEFATDRFSTYAIICTDAQTPGGEDENVYHIDLGIGSWTVGDVTVSTPEGTSGVESMLDTETIPTEMLANFDPETMDITLTTDDGFVIYLEIDENGNTTLASTRDGVELPPYGATLTFAVVAKTGNMEIVDKTEENACNADLAELTDDLISKLLTDEDQTRLENGEDVKVWLEVTDISASVSQTDKDLIDSKKGNATIGMYLDIDLLKKIGSDSPVNITETNGVVTITLKVPSSLINSNSSVTRTYQMIRVHNGVATVIPCTYNAANQTISFETNQFSTYALAYVDQQNNSGGGNTGGGSADGGNKGSGSTGNGSNDNVKDVVPKTGDASIAYVWFMLALVSGIGVLYFGKKGFVFKKGN